ncbi:MAG: hypothetical protein LBU32_11030 [Clostridiales bacterium]|nr:hypothetical protein [Clostridiales bacterium]
MPSAHGRVARPYGDISKLGVGISEETVRDAAKYLGLAIRLNGLRIQS